MSAQALNCPNCGAGVASDSSMCQFCKCRLKTMACPNCFGLMFIGSQFCPGCGAIAAPLDVSLDEKIGDCPRCLASLARMQVGTTSLLGCSKCDGLWLDAATFETVCADREKQSSVLGFLQGRSTPRPQMTKISYVPCPNCGELMNRNNFARSSGVIVDICRDHGVWFDSDELPAIIQFVEKGGMERSRERERQDLRDERSRLRPEQLAGGGSLGHENEDNSDIRSFVQSLFG